MKTYDFKGTVKPLREVYFKSEQDFGIYSCQVMSIQENKSECHLKMKDKITIKGNTMQLRLKEEYDVKASYIDDPKFGKQWNIVSIARTIDQYPTDSIGKRIALKQTFTDRQVDNMYAVLKDPYETFMKGDAASLVQVKGCGMISAGTWMKKFNENIPMHKLYVELSQYDLSTSVMKRLLDQYGSADVAIDQIKKDPYRLCNLKGFGWKTADKIALSGGMDEFSVERIQGFILTYLRQRGEEGYSFVTADELMAAIIENLGEDVPDFRITETIHGLEPRLYWNKEHTIIGLKTYWNLENNIADEIIRLLQAKSNFRYGDYQHVIQRKETYQGWQYTDEQLEGVRLALENNVMIITGGAGVGKSSVVDLILAILGNRYTYAQTALSGRAAARLAEITHKEGSTIHRLLGYPSGDEKYQMMAYNQDNHLPYDVVVVDEISMIGGRLFYYLLRAVRAGAKLILLGDTGQLEAIGECNVAHDLLACPDIPKIKLTKCHRQALKSAIITESIKVSKGIQLAPKDWAGTEIRGELQDLTLDCYSDASNTYHRTVSHFSQLLTVESDIMNIQVLSPLKNKGAASNFQLNMALQELYNPKGNEGEIVLNYSPHEFYGLRRGDKVINTVNNYFVPFAYEDGTTPVYNGNIGIVKEIDVKAKSAIIDFQDVGVVLMDYKMISNVELAYAVSIHKYQGSECKYVIVALDFNAYTLLSRELVYTAITRAKKHLILVTQNKALSYAIQHPATSCKQTYLTDILNLKMHPTKDFEF